MRLITLQMSDGITIESVYERDSYGSVALEGRTVSENLVVPGTVIEIPGSPHGKHIALDLEAYRYDYTGDRCKCPYCGGLGIPWGGWFHCEDCCGVALIETGQVFVQAPAVVA